MVLVCWVAAVSVEAAVVVLWAIVEEGVTVALSTG